VGTKVSEEYAAAIFWVILIFTALKGSRSIGPDTFPSLMLFIIIYVTQFEPKFNFSDRS
jgi:hypothetical protein